MFKSILLAIYIFLVVNLQAVEYKPILKRRTLISDLLGNQRRYLRGGRGGGGLDLNGSGVLPSGLHPLMHCSLFNDSISCFFFSIS